MHPLSNLLLSLAEIYSAENRNGAKLAAKALIQASRNIDTPKFLENQFSKEIKFAIKRKVDFGLPLVLQKYQFKLHQVAIPLYLSTNGIVSLYTNTTVPAMLARQFILRAVNIIKPIKQTFLQALR